MSAITKEFTKEQLQQIIETDHVQCGEASELARIALASLEAEPVAYMTYKGYLPHADDPKLAEYSEPMPLYTAPQLPRPAVPECYQRLLRHAHGMTMGRDWNKGTMAGHHREKLCKAVEDCRAAMLQGAEPVTDNTNQQLESLSRGDK